MGRAKQRAQGQIFVLTHRISVLTPRCVHLAATSSLLELSSTHSRPLVRRFRLQSELMWELGVRSGREEIVEEEGEERGEMVRGERRGSTLLCATEKSAGRPAWQVNN